MGREVRFWDSIPNLNWSAPYTCCHWSHTMILVRNSYYAIYLIEVATLLSRVGFRLLGAHMICIRIASFIPFLAALMPTALAQQPNCTQRSEFVRHLSQTYGERGVAIGYADDGNVVEFLLSKSGETWTIIMTRPDGISCRIAAGKFWERLSRRKLQRTY